MLPHPQIRGGQSMTYCPSTKSTCYAEVCKTWPCATEAEKLRAEADGLERLEKLRAEAPKPAFEIPDGE